MKDQLIADGKYVEVTYVLREDDAQGEELEVCPQDDPFGFTVGKVEVLEAFEQALMGKEQGEEFEFSLTMGEAYGEEDEEAFVEVPKSAFIVDGELDESIFEVGEVVPMETEDGDELMGIVCDVLLNSVVVDFNHPFAGLNLHFKGKIELVADAAPEDN
jgi:FKBP-type peptidyl-prolyl cis-trans isomerase SlyD